MTSLDRAREFLASKARKLAMTAVPLAALTAISVPQAKATLLFDPGTCESNGDGGVNTSPSSSCSASALGVMPNDANGLHLSAEAAWVATGISGGGLLAYTQWLGSANNASFNGVLPVSYDFTLSATGGGNFNWELAFFLNGSVRLNLSGSGLGTFQGTDAIVLNDNVLNWMVRISVDGSQTAIGDQLFLSVPDQSVDVNPVPEPASVMLFAPGIGYLLWRKRRPSHLDLDDNDGSL